MPPPKIKSLILVTGLSGAGKSTALNVLEDFGYFCIDNLPIALLGSYLEQEARRKKPHTRLAIHMDARDEDFSQKFETLLPLLKKKVPALKILFLKAGETALLRRFSETRRRHPLAQEGNLLKAIRREKKIFEKLKPLSDHEIDTTAMSVHALKETLSNLVNSPRTPSKLPLSLVSFGYRHGIPAQCDLVFDVRFLPNPYFQPKLKALDGTHPKVQDFVIKRPETGRFIQKVTDLLNFLIPQYAREGKSYLTVAFGCTGGRHRSVSLADYFQKFFSKKGLWASVEHRDINKL
ncbi:MAG: RNase adapter RapZ [bacterium]